MASLGELSYQTAEKTRTKVNWLSDRIQPYVLFKMPDRRVYSESEGDFVVNEGEWLEFSLGIFLLSTPEKKEINDEIYREIEGYDGLIILNDDKYLDRYTIKAGTNYYDAMISILQSAGIKKYNIEFTDKTLPNDLEYEPGTEKIKPLNALASAINYTPFWVDEYGYFTSTKYYSPQDKTPDYEYIDDPEMSVVFNGMEENLPITGVPNAFIAIYSNVDGEMDSNGDPVDSVSLSSSYINDNPESPMSTVNIGRTIVDRREVEDIADQESLDEYIKRVAFYASQTFGKLKFQTAIMPFHSYSDVLYMKNDLLTVEGKYAETNWKIPLQAGGQMEHEVRKVVKI